MQTQMRREMTADEETALQALLMFQVPARGVAGSGPAGSGRAFGGDSAPASALGGTMPVEGVVGGTGAAPLPIFPKKSRPGGATFHRERMQANVNKIITTARNSEGLAIWDTKAGLERNILILQKFFRQCKEIGKQEHVKHPLFHFTQTSMTYEEKQALIKIIYHVDCIDPSRLFTQCLNYMGISLLHTQQNKEYILTFDPGTWNDQGYRLVRGGDTKGGKPTVRWGGVLSVDDIRTKFPLYDELRFRAESAGEYDPSPAAAPKKRQRTEDAASIHAQISALEEKLADVAN